MHPRFRPAARRPSYRRGPRRLPRRALRPRRLARGSGQGDIWHGLLRHERLRRARNHRLHLRHHRLVHRPAHIRSGGEHPLQRADHHLAGGTAWPAHEELVGLAARSTAGDVTLVPAFGGLGAPWWDPAAVPLLAGLALDTGPGQLARAALESVAHQVDDVLTAMPRARRVVADGGLSRSTALMQLQADLSAMEVVRTPHHELSAAGVAHLAGLAHGLWTLDDLEKRADDSLEIFTPAQDEKYRRAAVARWRVRLAAAQSLGGEREERM
ncbi:FGGY-family carbohydrate kinase [Streptomyces sp. NPDC056721]|uniref:FGGY-family carbohydrate kinase n=1 Tax=Streptomyces sp. NPDC056721 TaxID=3345923 RepID=UPI0036BE3DC5